MRRRIVLQNIACCVLMLLLVACGNCLSIDHSKSAKQKGDINSVIVKLVGIVKSEREYSVRKDIADQIYWIVAAEDTQINAEGINAIALLLDDDEKVERIAAETLGYLGPRAKQALPALQKAYEKEMREINCPEMCGVSIGWDVTAVIQVAIAQISR